MTRYIRTTEPMPYDRVLFCALCDIEIHVTRGDMMGPYSDQFSEDELELRCEQHLKKAHPLRFWLWRKTGRGTDKWRKWLVGGLAWP